MPQHIHLVRKNEFTSAEASVEQIVWLPHQDKRKAFMGNKRSTLPTSVFVLHIKKALVTKVSIFICVVHELMFKIRYIYQDLYLC